MSTLTVRKLKVGLQDAKQAQVLSGLDADDKVLVGPVPDVPAAPDAATKPPAAAGS